jgi:putative flavoprotein involved in K+ transport
MKQEADVIIVGAGPAGLGVAVALRACGMTDVLIVDSAGVGASFDAWPDHMRLLTPSFFSNPFGITDLNAITPNTSPAEFLRTEHPTGAQYARYLRAVASYYKLCVDAGITVTGLRRAGREGGIELKTSAGKMRGRFVVWAAGEFAQPSAGTLRGAEIGLHSSRIRDYKELKGAEFAVIGGYESGVDVAIRLMWLGKDVSLYSRGEPWRTHDLDPSLQLAPFTFDRLQAALKDASGCIRFHKDTGISEIRAADGAYELVDERGLVHVSATRPIIATGFSGSLGIAGGCFDWKEGAPVFSEEADESTRMEGLFYSGPQLRHRGAKFCFIYKFRARFGIIAREIARRLDLEWEEPLKAWRKAGFMNDDLDCCTDCRCDVEHEEAAHV